MTLFRCNMLFFQGRNSAFEDLKILTHWQGIQDGSIGRNVADIPVRIWSRCLSLLQNAL